MLDIGLVHRREYDLEGDRSNPLTIAEAPGRIHFLGELAPSPRTDVSEDDNQELLPDEIHPVNAQNGLKSGFFLSAAIDRFINVAVSFRKDVSFRFYAADINERKRSTLINLKYKREDRWANYIKPVIYLFSELLHTMKGLNFSFCGDIPQNIGLASSLAIEVAAATALRSLFHVQINDLTFANKLHEAHFKLFGSAPPIADYLICFMARKDQFVVVDTTDGEIRLIKSPFSRFKFLLVDSRVPRIGTENEIEGRRAEITKGLELLSQKRKGASFKDFASSDLLEVLGDFPEQIRRRSIHIVEEIRRVNDAKDALERNDLASLAKIINHSHDSLRDLYEVSCPEVDWLVKRAQEIEGNAGSRMTGLGFGGCTYTIIRRELADEYKRRMEEYERIFGFCPVIYEVELATRARVIPDRTVSKPKVQGPRSEKTKSEASISKSRQVASVRPKRKGA
ncbi:MAG: galactokinase [Treponema sp.]|nr:galactokinase [Treponema sp.]